MNNTWGQGPFYSWDQNFKNMILLITDIYSDIKYYEFIEFNFTLLTKDKEGKWDDLLVGHTTWAYYYEMLRILQNS